MSRKILLEIQDNGNIYDAQGVFIITDVGYKIFELPKESSTSIQDIIKLKEAGFTSDEITDMKAKGVI